MTHERAADEAAGLAAYFRQALLAAHDAAVAVAVSEWDRTLALAVVAGAAAVLPEHEHLPEPLRTAALTEALDRAGRVTDEELRGRLLDRLAPSLPATLLPRARALRQVVTDDYHRALSLASVSARLTGDHRTEVLAEALDAARAVSPAITRAQALGQVARHAPPGQAATVFAEALAAAALVGREDTRGALLGEELGQHAPVEAQPALVAAVAVLHENARADALVELAPVLAGAALHEAFDLATALTDEHLRGTVLAALAPHLPDALLPAALAEATALGNGLSRARVLAAVAQRVSAGHVPEVVDAAGELPLVLRAMVLTALARHRAGPALDAARSRRIDGDRAAALAAVLPHLPADQREGVRAEAIAALDETSGNTRALSLVALAPFLAADDLPDAVDALEDLYADHDTAIAALTPHLPDHLRWRAVHVVGSLGNVVERAGALAELAEHLPAASLPDAMAVADDLGSWRDTVTELLLERALDLWRTGDRTVPVGGLVRTALEGTDRSGCLLLAGIVGAAIGELGGGTRELAVCVAAIRAVHE